MNSLPYYKRYQRDLIEGTVGLPFEIKTTYSYVIDLIYLHDGNLPDDSRYIAGMLGCSTRKWNSIRRELVERGKLLCFTDVSRNFLTNYRAIIELESLRKYQDNQREKVVERWKNKGLADTTVSQKSYQPEPDTDKKKKITKKKNPKGILETVLSPDRSADVIEHRNRLRKPLTARAAELLVNEFRKTKDPNAAADKMIERGWQGFNADWYQQVNGTDVNADYNRYVLQTTDENILPFEQWRRQHG